MVFYNQIIITAIRYNLFIYCRVIWMIFFAVSLVIMVHKVIVIQYVINIPLSVFSDSAAYDSADFQQCYLPVGTICTA